MESLADNDNVPGLTFLLVLLCVGLHGLLQEQDGFTDVSMAKVLLRDRGRRDFVFFFYGVV